MARNGTPLAVAYIDDGQPESRDCADNYRALTDVAQQRRLVEQGFQAAAEWTGRRRNEGALTNAEKPQR